jgi:hypothetical protein
VVGLIGANRQPGFAYYVRDAQAALVRFGGILVLSLRGSAISSLTKFGDTGIL